MDTKSLIKSICETCGFTQQDLAILLKVNKNTVARWARSELEPSAPLKARLQEILEERDAKSIADGNVLDRWDRIKGEKNFQRFANHIARFEFWPEQLFASSPHSGADEGWDGGSSDGSILVQAKFSNDSRQKAFKYIKNSFAEEYEKVDGKKVKKYILATNIELLPSQRKLLQSYKTSKGPEIIIWNKETLTILAQEHRWVLHHYFEYPQVPRLIPALVFKPESNYDTVYIGHNELLTQLLDFCKSDDCLLVVKGGAHVGKSRLLWEFLGQVRRDLPFTLPWILRSECIRSCREAIDKEINLAHRKHVILLDDAHTHYEDVEDLAEYTHAKKDNLKAIIFTNSSAMPLIRKALQKYGRREHKVTEIPRLTAQQLEQVFLNASGGYTPDRLDRIVKTLDRDLFLITEIGIRLKSRSEKVKVHDVLKDVKIDLVKQTEDLLELSTKQADLLLTELSLIAPFPTLSTSDTANKIHSQIANHCSMTQDEYQLCINRLHKGDIITNVGNYFTFRSKWIGYFFLRQKILDFENSAFCEKALARWIELVPHRVLANIATAGFDEGSGPVTKILKDLVISWTSEAENTTPTKRRHRLELLRGLASIIPSQVLALIQQYIEIPSKAFEQDLIKWGIEERNPDLDDIGPLVEEIGKVPEYVVNVLTLLSSLKPKALCHFYSNYAVPALVKKIIQSHLGDSKTIRQILDFEIKHDFGLFIDSFKVIMASVLEIYDSFEVSITISPLVVPAIPNVLEVRHYALDAALTKFEQLNPSEPLAYELVGALGDVGERLNHFPIRGELPLKEAITSEKKLILNVLEAKVKRIGDSPNELRLLAEIELLLLRWWTEDSADEELLEKLLLTFPRSPLYLAFRCYEQPEEIVFDFKIVLSKAGKKARRMWLLRNGSSWTAGVKFYKPLTKLIIERYSDNAALLNFFLDVSSGISGKCSSNPLIIEAVCSAKEDFATYALKSELFNKLHIKIQSALKKVQVLTNSDYIRSWSNDILKRQAEIASDEIFMFLITLMNSQLDDEERFSILLPFCDCENMIIKRDVAFRASMMFKSNKKLLLGIIERLNRLDNWHLKRHVSFALRQIVEDGIEIPQSLKEKLLCQLKNVPKLEHDHQEILKIVCTDFSTLRSFVEYRFEQDLKLDKDYEAIPYEGIACVLNLVTTAQQAEELLQLGFKVETESKGISRYRFEYLLKSVPFQNLEGIDSYLENSITTKLDDSDYEKNHLEIWWRIGILKLQETNELLFLKALEVADKHNHLDKVKGDFYSCLTESSWSCSIDSVPSHLVAAQERISSMIKKTSKLRVISFLESMLEGIKSQIDWHSRHDQDFVANH